MRKVKRFGIKDFEADMIVYDWDIELLLMTQEKAEAVTEFLGKRRTISFAERFILLMIKIIGLCCFLKMEKESRREFLCTNSFMLITVDGEVLTLWKDKTFIT